LKVEASLRNLGNQKFNSLQRPRPFLPNQNSQRAGKSVGAYEVWVVNSRYFDEEVEAMISRHRESVSHFGARAPSTRKRDRDRRALVTERVERGNSAIRSGDHTLQLIVSMWYKSAAWHKTSAAVAKEGLLWADPLASPPIHFLAARPAALAPCK